MTDKAEEVMAVSDEGGDAGECDDGTVSPTPATVPKKRGRPANSVKPKKVPSGRGRGRPAKKGGEKKTAKPAVSADGSDEEEGTASDGGSPMPNGDAGESSSPGRGRQPKAKRKLTHTIEATGKGRGRPKKAPKTDVADDDDEGADDNDDGVSSDYKPGKKATNKTAKKGRGRPKKVQNSDDESSEDKEDDDDDDEKRPAGRPPSSGINLNISSTGRGQGRPIKDDKDVKSSPVTTQKNKAETDDGVVRKRGRPATSGNKGPYQPTGKPRGRPKANAVQDKNSQDDEEDEEDKIPSKKSVTKNSNDEDDGDKENSDSEDGI